MENYKEFFKNKKITVMGLGLLGGALNDIIFLSEVGANLIVTDLKSESELSVSVKALARYKNIKFTLGGHDLADFRNRDMVLEPGNVAKDSIYLKEAKKYNTPVFVSESLFAKYAKGVKIIGVTGTRGKTMTTMLIYEILKQSLSNKVYLGGNIRNTSTLSLLKKAKTDDIVVLELDSWALHGIGNIGISPSISVFTSFMEDHMNYYKGDMEAYFTDKKNIFKYQNEKDFLVINPDLSKKINKNSTKSKIIKANLKNVENFKFIVPGIHQKMNLALAYEVARLFNIKENQIKKIVKDFKGVEGRLEFLKDFKGIKIYNDNNATTPEATIAGLNAFELKKNQNLILISGGASKNINLDNFIKTINKKVDQLYLIPGTGTSELLKYKLKPYLYLGKDLKDIVKEVFINAKKGDIVLFSPAFASFGMFQNEYERNDQFIKIIKSFN